MAEFEQSGDPGSESGGAEGGNETILGAPPDTQQEGTEDAGQQEGKGDAGQEEGSTEEKSAAEEEGGKKEGEEQQGAPDSYEDFTLPEGFELKGERLEKFQEFAKAKNWSQETAQEMVDFYIDQQKSVQAEMENRIAERAKEDIETIKKMKAMNGGDGFEANVGKAVSGIAIAQKAINGIFGDDAIDLRDHLEATGIGNDPALLQMAYAYQSAVSEDGFVSGAPGTGGSEKPDRVSVMYPK